MSAISSIKNLGPAYERECAKAGIYSAEELRALGPDATYAKLLKTGTKPHFIGYYVLVMALQGRPWNDCKGDEKKQLRARFDALKAQTQKAPMSELEEMLNIIGVVEKPTDNRHI
ncbi:TfoX/Sxy family protein [Parasulfitobacter algicola]|uniref:TfoX/Sxy family protein n=1 Tax=Parasulfitobacter algicola TaxID=2614809 RepID=A0ABX2IYU3_9RHOB|nr:TfoX/Sxy family protein [Sulfitobacter algicola]NSX55448.1 TfoX/Sxy family protein [Sulfitobacter algicola]